MNTILLIAFGYLLAVMWDNREVILKKLKAVKAALEASETP